MSCPCDGVDLCFGCCDTVPINFEQCGAVWPTSADSVVMKISCAGGCGGGTSFEVPGIFVAGPPGKVSFTLGPDVTCSLPKGVRQCDYKIVAIAASGARFTFQRGRITVK